MNFIKAFRSMGGAGVAYSNMEALMLAAQTCTDPVGETQPTITEADPHAFRNMEGGAGVAYSNVEAYMRAAQTCKDVVGEKSLQPAMERYMRAREDDHGP